MEVEHLKMQSQNIVDENIKKIAELFPNTLTEVVDEKGNLKQAIDFDVLKQELSDCIVSGREERYQFTWPEKRNSILLANSPISETLRPCVEESLGKDGTPGKFDSENLYIEGDNLDVLKLLQQTYMNKIKMIYIDPPYNTGNDFVYEDDFSENTDEYLNKSGQFDKDGNKLFQNTESNGRFHTDWLNMIYPRLKLAKNLLTDDGIIFISIDDNEVYNLKKCLDEIFGANNFLNHITWISNITGRQIGSFGAAKTWESVLIYAKNKTLTDTLVIDASYAKELMPDAYKGFEKEILEDKFGNFAVGDTLYNHNRMFNEETRPNLVYSIYYNPTTEEIVPDDIGKKIDGFVEILPHKNADGIHKYHAWRWSKQKVINENYNLIIREKTNGYEIYTKIRDYSKTALKDLITNIKNGDTKLQKLFDDKKIFDYPKPTELIKILFNTQKYKDGIFLDFFSGSATSAEAIFQLNNEDNLKRNFILVQLPEVCDKNTIAYKCGYKNICEIGKERIRRASKKIREENPLSVENQDLGFRVLKLDSTNMKDIYYTPEEIIQGSLDGMLDNIKEDRTPKDLLFQAMLELAIPLSSTIEESTIAGKKVFNVNTEKNYLLACFDSGITNEIITEIAKKKPYYFVMRDNSMANDSVATNFEQIFKTYSPETKIKVL